MSTSKKRWLSLIIGFRRINDFWSGLFPGIKNRPVLKISMFMPSRSIHVIPVY